MIFAGGTGQRMNLISGMPKQFLLINDKPIIIHTLEIFSKHQEIDGIVVVCLKEYINDLHLNIIFSSLINLSYAIIDLSDTCSLFFNTFCHIIDRLNK
ncbi:2-C-methyl-D-erythritol 4-phosphate cytidylyltransferase [Campylobacter jejuni]|uniref:2-C-methyl-D-erythritol 4-phosphate cytidylyltransferase n=1 Tax=Campylobacter jejuni TaxID=197 RepID=UPI00255BA71A|nr:2-C-methyl-D-erythritol 4-phosphate cytidylyltransferase [Campylobacter jejuni]